MSGPQGTGTWQAGASRGTTRIRWSAWRMASNPSGGFLQVRRKLGAPRRRSRSGDRSISWLCSWIVLVAEVDERRLVRPLRVIVAIGSSHPASCSDGERASEAGSRRQSREHGGGLSMILYLQAFVKAEAPEWGREPERSKRKRRPLVQGREHSSRKGVLVSVKPSSLTRRRPRRYLAASPGKVRPKGRVDSSGAAT
jgi:hypothetical protein